SIVLLSGCLHETIFSGLLSFGVVNSEVVNGPDRAPHRTVGKDCPLRGSRLVSRWLTRNLGSVYRRNHLEADLYSSDAGQFVRCVGESGSRRRENRCGPGLVTRLQNRRLPFHRRRERAETTLVGKWRPLQSSKT